ncbi:MAG: hypothetical protein AAGA70_00010 [Pseudomonadota bacterium]
MGLLIASDYQVLLDGPIKLGQRGEFKEQFQWFVPKGFLFATQRRDAAVLSFNIRTENAAEVRVEAIGSGPTVILSGTPLAQGLTRTYQETFDLAGIVNDSGNSIGTPIGSLLIEFSVKEGPATFSDIVVHSKIAFNE